MKRGRQSQILLAPLLDVVFIVLLFYVASLVGRGHEESRELEDKEKALSEEQEQILIRLKADRQHLFEAEQELAAERSQRKRLEESLDELGRDYKRLAELADSREELIAELEKRFGSEGRAIETAALLTAVEQNFDIYEVTFYADRRIRIVTPKGKTVEQTFGSVEEIELAFGRALPALFDPTRAVFVVRAEGKVPFSDLRDFFERKKKQWIMTLDRQGHPIKIENRDE